LHLHSTSIFCTLNILLLIGNLTRDPELRYTPKGTPVAELGLAISRVYSGEDGEKKEETTFVEITLWGRQAELAGRYLTKGRSLFVEGRSNLTLGTTSRPVKGVPGCG
jgi:single-strand DNA-binding protein